MIRVRIRERAKRPGRITVLNNKLIKKIARLTREGLPADAICDYIGIAPPTFWAWMRKGERYLVGDCQPEEYAVYGRFVLRFRKAAAIYRLNLSKQLHTQGNRDWVRCMTILERRDRRSFGRHDPMGGGDDQIDPNEAFL